MTQRKRSRSRSNSNREVMRVRRQLDMKHQHRRDIARLKRQPAANFETEEADFGARPMPWNGTTTCHDES